MSEATVALLAGLAIFLVPTAIFAWSALTKRGRAAHERAVAEANRLPVAGGWLPVKPPRTRFGKWGTRHPWAGAAIVGANFGVAVFLLTWLVLGRSVEHAAFRGVFYLLEVTLIFRWIYGAQRRHFGDAGGGPSPRARDSETEPAS